MGKVLALDYGLKRVGVATGDLDMRIAFPRGVIENKGRKYLLKKISEIVTDLDVRSIVVGMPFNVNNPSKDNEMLNIVKSFVSSLKGFFLNIDVLLTDEALSSFEADKFISDAIAKGANNMGRDAYAAQIILQRFFDKM